MSDNLFFRASGGGDSLGEYLELLMSGVTDRVHGYKIDNRGKAGARFVLFRWAPNDRQCFHVFPGKHGVELDAVTPLILAWLKDVKYPQKPDIDGDCGKGWLVYNDEPWGHVEPHGSPAFAAIEPYWLMCGK